MYNHDFIIVISKLIMGRRRRDQRRAKKPKCDWTDSSATSLSEDTIGKPYGVRDENGHRVEHTSADKNGEYYVGDIVRKKETKCMQERDWGGGQMRLPIRN